MESETAGYGTRQHRAGKGMSMGDGSGRPASAAAQALHPPAEWDREADVVVIGAGAAGMPAAIVAREAGFTVILVEAEADIGGHAITSGGNVPLGGGTSVQQKYGIEDTPDLLFRDLTDWSVVGPNGFPDYRYNDREIIRAFADNSAPCFEWLLAHGVIFVDKAPDAIGGNSVGNSVPREMHCAVMDWPMVQTGEPADPAIQKTRSSGNGLMRPLEVAAKKAGVEILLEHRMTSIYRQSAEFRPRARHRGRPQGNHAQHPRPQGGHHRDRRFDRQCQFPPHVRSAPDRRILRPCRHAVVGPGRQRRTRGDGDRRVAVGALQPDRRIRRQCDQAGFDRLPIRLPQSAVDAGQPRYSIAPAPRGLPGGELAGRHPGQYAGQALLRRDWRAIHRQQLQLDRTLCPGQLAQRQEHQIQPQQFPECGIGRDRRRPQWRRSDLGDLRRRRGRARSNGGRRRRMSTSPPASSSAPIGWPISPKRSS